MPQPLKPEHLRQRRNKAPSAATLKSGAVVTAPELPRREWDPQALAFWKDVWESPMAQKFLKADVHGLFILMDLVDRYWKGEGDLAAEIRLQRVPYGLTPIDRARLQWKIEEPKAEAEQEEPEVRRDFDPSKVLEMPRKK